MLHELTLLRLQSSQVQRLLLPSLRRFAWNTLGKAVLPMMLKSMDKAERSLFAVRQILKLWRKGVDSDVRLPTRENPESHIQADKLEI